MGAWIEIDVLEQIVKPIEVAPLVGAWIEMLFLDTYALFDIVAPLVGAWIEITVSKRLLRL